MDRSMKSLLIFSITFFPVFIFNQCEQIVSNSVDQQVAVITGTQSLAIHNNMSVPVYYLVIEQESAERANLIHTCSAENIIEAGNVKEFFNTDIYDYKSGVTVLVHAWKCNFNENPDELTIFRVETP